MYHPRLYGSFYEMGFKYGSLLKKNGFQLPKISREKIKFGLESYGELKAFYPEVIEEIKGFAKGINEVPDILASFLLSINVLKPTGQCSNFAYKNDRSVIIGRNYDCLFQFKKFTESSLIAPTDKFSYIGQSDVFIGRSDGINEKGLSIAIAFVNGTMVQPGINFYFIVRHVLENCSTTKEAIETIRKIKVSTANNFLIADSTGEMVVIESCPQQMRVRRPLANKNFIYSTNQFILDEMIPFDSGGVEWSKSKERYFGLHDHLTKAIYIDMQKAKEILSGKESCICLNLKTAKFGTLWSVVANLNELRIERAEGQPKTTNFKTDLRLGWWLEKRNRK